MARFRRPLRGPKAPIVARSDRRERGDSTSGWRGARGGRGAEAGPPGGGGRALSASGRDSEPCTCARAGPARRARLSCGRQQQPVRPSAPQGRRGCLVLSGTPAAWPERKGGHCLLGQNYCSIVWPRPAWLLPGLCPLPALGVFRIPDLSAPAPNPSPAAPLGDRGPSRRVSAFRSSPEAPATPLGLRSIGSLSQGRCPPHPHPSSAPIGPSSTKPCLQRPRAHRGPPLLPSPDL